MTSAASSWRNRLLQRTGMTALLVGALTVAIGIPQTSRAGGNEACPTGTVLVAKFNYTDGSYVFEKPAGNESVVVIINGTATGGGWTSATPIAAMIVKGGTGATSAAYDPAASSGIFSNAGLPLVGAGNVPDISNLQFCGPTGPTGTTTEPPTTQPPTTQLPTTEPPATEPPVTQPPTTQPPATQPPATEPPASPAPTTTLVAQLGPEPSTTLVAQLGPEPSTTVVGVSDTGTTLPRTGSQPSLLLAYGALVLVLGVVLTMAGRMRNGRS